MQLLAVAAPDELDLGHAVVVVQHEPVADLQLVGPREHVLGHLDAGGVGNDLDRGRVHAEQQLDALRVQRQAGGAAVVGHEVFQVRQPLGHGLDLGLGNGLGLRHEGVGERGADGLDVAFLRLADDAQQVHALAQSLQQLRQVLNHAGAVGAVGLGARGPDQLGGHALEHHGVLALRAVAQRGDGQHLGPDLEQELADLVAHRHVVEHLAQLDGVLDRHRLLLLDLLRHAHDALRGVALREVAAEESDELVEHQLEHALAGLGVLLDHLHHALDLVLERAAGDGGGVEAHHAGAHAVDQHARGVLQGAEEFGLGDGHAQHGHLQPREPHARGERNALFREDGLEHQRHDLDRGLVGRGGRALLELGGAPAQVDGGLLDQRGLLAAAVDVLRGRHAVGDLGIGDGAGKGA
ncbi:hypothetical protein D3C86_414630 [compost metagenome]